MILKVILVIFLCFIAGNYLSSMLAIRFVWDGLVHLGGLVRLGSIAVCFLFVRFLLRRGKEKNTPVEDDFSPSFWNRGSRNSSACITDTQRIAAKIAGIRFSF